MLLVFFKLLQKEPFKKFILKPSLKTNAVWAAETNEKLIENSHVACLDHNQCVNCCIITFKGLSAFFC